MKLRLTKIKLISFSVLGIFLGMVSMLSANQPVGFKKSIREPIQPIPRDLPLDAKKVALGEKLFHDPRLSKDNTISCASCHALNKGGTDNLQFSKGVNGAMGDRNSPTVFNSRFNFKQFWDGRSESLEDQVAGPLTNPKEMATDWKSVVKKMEDDRIYSKLFEQAYTDGLNPKNISDAIATFEKSLITPDSRFDQFLRGQTNAISKLEKRGYHLFKSYGCVSCHQGVNVGGNMFQKFGVVEEKVGQKNDLFKVPSLRNIELTSPYFHDGSARTLDEAIFLMGRYQLGRQLSAEEVSSIKAFLKTLTGKYKGVLLSEL